MSLLAWGGETSKIFTAALPPPSLYPSSPLLFECTLFVVTSRGHISLLFLTFDVIMKSKVDFEFY